MCKNETCLVQKYVFTLVDDSDNDREDVKIGMLSLLRKDVFEPFTIEYSNNWSNINMCRRVTVLGLNVCLFVCS